MIKPNTLFFFLTASTLAATHYLALEFYLYWLYPWFDVPMHFLGGVTAALGYLSIHDFVSFLPLAFYRFLPTVAFVLLVALAWEVFEAAAGLTEGQLDYVVDTATDICLGLFGGSLGYFVGKWVGYFNYG